MAFVAIKGQIPGKNDGFLRRRVARMPGRR
jgi:hypothetical protein